MSVNTPWRWIACLVLLAAAAIAAAAEPPEAPILRVETGMHAGPILRAATDTQNRYLVTASQDKTARVWELASGRLLQTLRPPIGEGDEGKLYAVALSPDGRTIALGGWTNNESGDTENIYIFDRESGKLVRRIGGLPAAVNHLVFSRDGRYLASGLGGNSGIRVYRATDYGLVLNDGDYGDSSYGLDFARDGRLVTTSIDGFIRLYDPSSKRIAKVRSAWPSNPLGWPSRRMGPGLRSASMTTPKCSSSRAGICRPYRTRYARY